MKMNLKMMIGFACAAFGLAVAVADNGGIVPVGDVTYMKYNPSTFTHEKATLTLGTFSFVTEDTRVLEDGGWYVVQDKIEIKGGLEVRGTANLVLCRYGSLRVVDVPNGQAGIAVEEGTKLTIYGQTTTAGSLVVSGGADAAAIGSGIGLACGTVVIDSGSVWATSGGPEAEPIGAGRWGSPGVVTINSSAVWQERKDAPGETTADFDGVLVVGGKVLRNAKTSVGFKVGEAVRDVELTTDEEGRFAAEIPGVAENAESVELVSVDGAAVTGERIVRLPRLPYALVAAKADAVVSDDDLAVVEGSVTVDGNLTLGDSLLVKESLSVVGDIAVSEFGTAITNDLAGVKIANGGKIRWIGPEEEVLNARLYAKFRDKFASLVALNNDFAYHLRDSAWYATLTETDGQVLPTDDQRRIYFNREPKRWAATDLKADHFDMRFADVSMGPSPTGGQMAQKLFPYPPADPVKNEARFNFIAKDNVFTAPADGFYRLRLSSSANTFGGVAMTLKVIGQNKTQHNILNPGWIRPPTRYEYAKPTFDRSYTFAVQKGEEVHLRLLFSEGELAQSIPTLSGVEGTAAEIRYGVLEYDLGVQLFFRRLGTDGK